MQQLIKLHSTGAMIILAILIYLIGMLSHGTDLLSFISFDGSVVEWLKRRARDQHGLGSKPTRAILVCPWERHFTAHSPAWWSWQAVLN